VGVFSWARYPCSRVALVAKATKGLFSRAEGLGSRAEGHLLAGVAVEGERSQPLQVRQRRSLRYLCCVFGSVNIFCFFWISGFGFRVLGFGFWVLIFGFRVLGFGFWVLGVEGWGFGFGLGFGGLGFGF
jgi:hypothetical protein